MKPYYIYIVLLIIIAAGLYYLFGDAFGGDPVQVRSGRLIDIDPAEVTGGIYLRGDSIRIEFKRSGSGWKVTEPVETAGALNILDDLIENISESIITEVIEDPADLSDFGLEDPLSVIILYSEGRPEPDTIRIGSRAPTSYLSYTSVGSSDDVYLSNEIITDTARQTLFHFRNKKFININPYMINRIGFISGRRVFAVEKKDEGWVLENSGVKVRERYINSYLQILDRMLIYRFIPASGENLEKFGLLSPNYMISLDSYEKNINFSFGSRVADMIYAARDGMNQVILVRTDLLAIFSMDYQFIFDLSVTDAAESDPDLIEFSGHRGHIKLVYSGRSWKGPGGADTAESIIDAVSELQFTDLPSSSEQPPADREKDLAVTFMKDGDVLDRIVLTSPKPGVFLCWSRSRTAAGTIGKDRYTAILETFRQR